MSKPVLIVAISDYRTDATAHLRELGQELDGINEALRLAVEQEICEVVSIAEASAEKIVDAFTRHENAVVGFHFAGHSNGYELLMKASVYREGFANFLGKQENLQFVFLNGCATHRHIRELHLQGVPAVIATSQEIKDKVAVEVALRFYHFLGLGKSLETAFQACQSVEDMKQGPSRDLPLLQDAQKTTTFFPWQISYREGMAPVAKHWNLATASGSSLFGLPPLAQTAKLPPQPFLYLKSYDASHAPLFFGRGAEIRQLYDVLTNAALNNVILFHGSTGVGKSSVLNAGLIPRIVQEFEVRHIQISPKAAPQALLDVLNTPKEKIGSSWLEIEQSSGKPLLVIIDQLEAIFTRPDQHYQQELDELMALCSVVFSGNQAKPKGKLLLAYRKEYHPEIQRSFEQHALPFTPFFLERLSREGIKEAVSGVAKTPTLQQQYQLEVEEIVANLIADDLMADPDSSVAPVLQILLTRMWEEAAVAPNGQRVFSEALYRQRQREGILLSNFLEREFKTLAANQAKSVQSGLLYDLLFFLITKNQTAALQPLQVVLDRYHNRQEEIKKLVASLKDAHIILQTQDNKNEDIKYLRLSHDTLAPLLHQRFLTSELPGQQATRVLQNVDWKNWEKTPADHLLSKGQLDVVLKGLEGMPDLKEKEKQFLSASQQRVDRAKRQRKIIVASIVTAGILLVILLGALWQNEKEQARAFESRLLAAQATSLVQTAPEEALSLLQKSLQLSPKDPVLLEQYYRVNRDYILAKTLLKDSIWQWDAAVFSPDAKQLYLAQSQGANIALKSYRQTEEHFQLQDSLIGASLNIYSLVQAPTTAYIFGGSPNQKTYLWNANGTLILSDTLESGVSEVAISQDGAAIAWINLENKQLSYRTTAGGPSILKSSELSAQPTALLFFPGQHALFFGLTNGILGWWNPLDASQNEIEGHSGPISSMAISQNGQLIATGDRSGLIKLWKSTPAGLQEIALPTMQQNGLEALLFTPNNQWLFAADQQGGIQIWSTNEGKHVKSLIGHSGTILAMAIDQDRKLLFTTGVDQTTRKWPLNDFLPDYEFQSSGPTFYSIAIDQSDQLIIAGSADRKIYAWELQQEVPQGLTYNYRERVTAVALSPDGKWMLSGDRRGKVSQWSLPEGQASALFSTQTSRPIHSLDIAPDGNHWAMGGEDHLVYLRQHQDTSFLDTLNAFPDGIKSLKFSTNGERLASVGLLDSTIIIYNLLTKKELTLTHPEGDLIGIAELPQGRNWISASKTGYIYVWNSEGKLQNRYSNSDQSTLSALAIHPLNNCFATGTEDGMVCLWTLDGHIYQKYYHGTGQKITDLVFSKTGEWLFASGANGELFKWRFKEGPSL